jgi:hypothetical protein
MRITMGEANIGTFHKTENSYRKYCKVCGGHLTGFIPLALFAPEPRHAQRREVPRTLLPADARPRSG